MEETHINGVVENEAKDHPPTDTSIAGAEVNGHDKETMPESSEGAVEDQKQSFKFVLKTKTSVSSVEESTEDKGNDTEGEKVHSYVIRSQTSVESYEDTKNPRTPPSDSQLKFTVRTKSTEEHDTREELRTTMENTVEENGQTTKDDVFNDIGVTQNEDEKEIAAKATEIVTKILEKLENEERSKNEQQEQTLDVESTQEHVVVANNPAGEELEQRPSEDKEDKAEVEVMKFETNEDKIEIEQIADVEATPATESAVETKQVEGKEDKAEVLVMKFESNEEEEEVQEKVDVQTKPGEVQAAAIAVRDLEEQLCIEDQQDKAEVPKERANVELAPENSAAAAFVAQEEKQPSEDQEGKSEVITLQFESKQEEVQIEETADVDEPSREMSPEAAEDQQPSEDKEGKAEILAMKFESKVEQEEVEETDDAEEAPKIPPTLVTVQGEQPSEDKEDQAELVAMKFESREERVEVEEKADLETAPQVPPEVVAPHEEPKPATEDQEGKAEVVTMKFESREEKTEVEEKADVETAPEVPPEVVAPQEEQATNEDQDVKSEVVTMKFESREEKVEVEEKADVETAPEVPPEVVVPQEEPEPATEDQEGKAEVVTMKFESRDEKVEVEEKADAETAPEVQQEVVAPQEEQATNEDQDVKAEVVTMKFESRDEKVEVEEKADVETAPEVQQEVVAPQEEQAMNEDQDVKAEVVTMKFESREEKTEVEEKADVETAPEVPPEVVAPNEEPQLATEDQEGKAEVVTMKFESRDEKVEVEEKADVETAPVVPPEVVVSQDDPQPATEDQEGKAEVLAIKFESKEEKVELEETVEVEAGREVTSAVAVGDAEQPSEDQESKAEVVAMKFESREEQFEVEEKADIEATQTDISAATEGIRKTCEEEAEAEIVVMKFESSEESVTKEETAFEEAKEAKIFVDAVKIGTASSQQDEEPLSPKQEYVAEQFLNTPQSQHEMQDDGGDDSDELEEKPIIKVRLPEESFQTDLDQEQDDDVVEVHGTEVDLEEIFTSPEFETQPVEVHSGDEMDNDSEGEIEVKIRRFSQENQELIHDESDDDENSPVDWMAKDDVDEVVFRGEALSPTSLNAGRTETQKQIDQETRPTKKEDSHILVQTGGKIYIDDVVVPDTREVEVCSGLENMFTSEELREPEKVKPDESALDYDLDKDIEEEQKRLTSEKRVASIGGIKVVAHEEVLAREFKRKEVSDLDIKLMDEKDEDAKGTVEQTEDEQKPPSPLEAKEVKERGIKEIFETETFRASGEFLSPVQEGEEYNTNAKDNNLTFERKTTPVADEEALQASEQEKRCSLEWSLLDKWKEMEQKAKRESLELEESKGETKIQSETIKETEAEQPEAAVLAVSETKENEPNVMEFKIRETDEPEVTVTKTTETTPSSVSKVTTTKTVTKSRIIKARTEVQPDTQKEILETPDKDEETQEEPQEVPESPAEEEKPEASLEEPTAPMSTILFRMDGTPIVIPPEPQQAQIEEKPLQESSPEEEQVLESQPKPEVEAEKQTDVAPMATILFKMDGTPVVIPAAPTNDETQPPSPKPKTVVFTGVRPQSLASVESVRGEREGVPPLAGEEESDIDDSSLHLAKQTTGASKPPTVSPVKEVATPEKGNQPDEEQGEAEIPLLDNSTNRGQRCCVIL